MRRELRRGCRRLRSNGSIFKALSVRPLIYNYPLTFLVDSDFVLDVLRTRCEAALVVRQPRRATDMHTYFKVFNVSCLCLKVGAMLHMSNPSDVPPRASCNIRVNFEFL